MSQSHRSNIKTIPLLFLEEIELECYDPVRNPHYHSYCFTSNYYFFFLLQVDWWAYAVSLINKSKSINNRTQYLRNFLWWVWDSRTWLEPDIIYILRTFLLLLMYIKSSTQKTIGLVDTLFWKLATARLPEQPLCAYCRKTGTQRIGSKGSQIPPDTLL